MCKDLPGIGVHLTVGQPQSEVCSELHRSRKYEYKKVKNCRSPTLILPAITFLYEFRYEIIVVGDIGDDDPSFFLARIENFL